MNILLVSWFDNGNQLQSLAEAIRKYTEYDALHLNCQTTYLDYEKDLYYPDHKQSPTGVLELKDKIRGYDDFFIFSEFLPDDIPLKPILEELGIYRKLTKNNVIVRTGGSMPQSNPEHYLFTQLRRGWTYAGGYHDYLISSGVGFVAFTRNILPIDKMPEPSLPMDKVRVAFAPTKKRKGVDAFNRVMNTLTKEYNNVEAVAITGKSWREAIKIKSECNVTFDKLIGSTYGNSAIESMYLSHAVLSKIDLFNKLLFPDLPIITINTERDLYAELKNLIEKPKIIEEIGKNGKDFALKMHHPKVIAMQWDNLIRFVSGEEHV